MAKRTVYKKPPMKFNPSLQNYEVDLPSKRKHSKYKETSSQTFWIILMISILGLLLAVLLL